MPNSIEKKGKRRYLGSIFSAYAALILPLFSIAPLVFAIIVLKAEISVSTVFLSLMCLSCSFLWMLFAWKRRNQLYAWGVFTDSAVYVTVLLQKPFSIPYNCCQGCGIGFYRHAFLNSRNSLLGSDCYFIFLSKQPFDEQYRDKINQWLSSSARIKVSFNKQLYDFLINRLAEKQARMLERDYNRFINV